LRRNVFLAFVFFIIVGSLFAVSKNEPQKQNLLTLKTFEKQKEVNVIIRLKDTESSELSKTGSGKTGTQALEVKREKIAKVQKTFLSLIDKNSKNFKLKHKYSLVNGISASITKDEFEKLTRNSAVDKIYLDIPMHIMLNDSVRLVNASAFWGINISGQYINGTGETVCILDTGIDYRHPALGGCNIVNQTRLGNNVSFTNESSHPYANGLTQIFKINFTGFTKIGLHFVNISLEEEYDYLKILDPNSNNNTIAVYTGNHTDIWTPSVNGDTVYVLLESDESVVSWGFKIDQIINGTVNTSINWSTCNKVIGGWDFTGATPTQDDEDPMDDNGHGTHVAGIIASENSTYRGVAPGARIAAVKVMDSSGSGTDTDIMAGLEFCIENRERLNISVISMSLGSAELWYSTSCDSDFPMLSELVDQAQRLNISIIIASGNENNSTGISYPACLENVTAVGATTKSDNIDISYSNSGPALDILAPGTSIRSVNWGGGFATQSGTSMATPHAAGAFLLLRNFKRLENGTVLTPSQILQIIKNTGRNITDSRNNQNFARINLSSALAYIDDTPRMTFTQILSNNTNISTNFTFINLTATEPILNATIEIDSINYSMNGASRLFYYNITGLSNIRHNFTIFIKDTTHSTFSSSGKYSFIVDTVKPNINSISNTSVNESVYIVTFNTTEPANATIFYGTTSGNYPWNISNSTYQLSHNMTLRNLSSSTSYFYYILVFDLVGNSNRTAELSFETVANTNPPVIIINNPLNDSKISTANIIVNATTDETARCSFNFTNGFNLTLAVNLTHVLTNSFSDGTYNMTVNCSDNDGFSSRAFAQNFSFDTTDPSINITTPENNTIFPSSYLNSIIFSTDETSTCTYGINTDANLSATSTDNRYFTATFSLYTNSSPLHNITVNCTDGVSNSRLKVFRFRINDTTAPTISVTDESATSSAITISFSTNEPGNWTISMEGQSEEYDDNFGISHSVSFTGLDSKTEYDYNISACDVFRNCAEISGSKSTGTQSSGGGGGGGSSSGSAIVSSNIVRASQQWKNPAEGEYTMEIKTEKIALRQVEFNIESNLSGTVVLTVDKIDALPLTIPNLSGGNYQYLKIDKTKVLDSGLKSLLLKFRIEKSWITEMGLEPEGVSLYRYTTQWDKLPTENTRSDRDYYYYESKTPGLSYFLINGENLTKPEEPVQDYSNITINNTQIGIENNSLELQKNETVMPEEGMKSKKSPVFVTALIALALIAGIAGFILLKKKR